MSDHTLYLGTDQFTGRQYLLRTYDDGTAEIAVRDDERHTWSPPIAVQRVPAEVTS